MIEIKSIANHLSLDEIKMRMQMTAGYLKIQKWLVIYNAIIDPRPISEIAKHTGLSESSVDRIISEYNTLGPESLEPPGKEILDMWCERHQKSMSM